MSDENEIPPEALVYPPRTVSVLNNGNTAIVTDDHCYAVRNLGADGKWGWSAWIFKEALDVLKTLPDNPDEALYANVLMLDDG